MSSEYEAKFAEMRTYVPFLDGMIRKLESVGDSNPRQAQLQKIRALRDLIMEKNKRMKIENLIKCEQVLINLYAKVEQTDCSPSGNNTSNEPEDKGTSLQMVRQKLRNVTKAQDMQEAMQNVPSSPCINSDSTLFQRRPNKFTETHFEPPDSKTPTNTCKRNYTRVLVSPEPSSINWSQSSDDKIDNRIFQIRSPKKSIYNYSPMAHRKERKKSRKRTRRSSKDDNINITLNVPKNKLNSLNTDDIFERIMSCRDTDVDINQLSVLRTEILQELKQTGANQDISNLLLKSYKNKSKNKKNDIEEGELSDSESESIEKIYGNLKIELKNEINQQCQNLVTGGRTSSQTNTNPDRNSHKIKISLIISNSDDSNKVAESKADECDQKIQDNSINKHEKEIMPLKKKGDTITSNDLKVNMPPVDVTDTHLELIGDMKYDNIQNKQINIDPQQLTGSRTKPMDAEKLNIENECLTHSGSKPSDYNKHEEGSEHITQSGIEPSDCESQSESENLYVIKDATDRNRNENIANFYKPLNQNNTLPNYNPSQESSFTIAIARDDDTMKTDTENNEYIPFISQQKSSAEARKEITDVDILKALKNEIHTENVNNSSLIDTPVLHQPKVTKVTDKNIISLDTNNKKRITLEKYKEKSMSTSKTPLFIQKPNNILKEDICKKQSRGLTVKECERFNFYSKFDSDSVSSDDDRGKCKISVDDVYGDLRFNSPKRTSNDNKKPEVPTFVNNSGKNNPEDSQFDNSSPRIQFQKVISDSKCDNNQATSYSEEKDLQFSSARYPRYHQTDANEANQLSNIPLLMAPTYPNMTPTYPNMTPTYRSYEQKLSAQSTDFNDINNRKHVYAPINDLEVYEENNDEIRNVFSKDVYDPLWDIDDFKNNRDSAQTRNSSYNNLKGRENDQTYMAPHSNDIPKCQQRSRRDRDPRLYTERKEDYSDIGRSEYPRTPIHYFGRSECPTTPSHPFGRKDGSSTPNYSFGRTDGSTTPAHSFGRSECATPNYLVGRSECLPTSSYHVGRSDYNQTSNNHFSRKDCPLTPSHSFGRTDSSATCNYSCGRADYPTTPSHPFGRTDGQSTPSHPFGRIDCPATPSHPFGRTDGQSTPSHPFGRIDCPTTPSHPFGRTDGQSTPSHPFGRIDCPATPSHSFGRSDSSTTSNQLFGTANRPLTPSYQFGRAECPSTPVHPFGRTDYLLTPVPSFGRSDCLSTPTPSFGRADPRTQRRSECPTTSHSYGRRTGSHQNIMDESSDGLYEYPNEMPIVDTVIRGKRELSSSRSFSDKRLDLQEQHHKVNERLERESNNNFRRSQSMGRSISTEVNSLSVKSHDRSFTIDTSVNRTFQSELETTFDEKRRRASSVGRYFACDSSSGRPFDSDLIGPRPERQINTFNRARSIGRDFERVEVCTSIELERNKGESFEKHSLRARSIDRQSRPKYVPNMEKRDRSRDSRQEYQPNKYSSILNNSRNRKDRRESEHISKQNNNWSSKRYRDTRITRVYDPSLYKKDNRFSKDKKYQDHKINAMVYTSDNLAKGTILGPGSGVKNYKIPKIKRPMEEKETDNIAVSKNIVAPETEKSEKGDSSERLSKQDQKCKDEDCSFTITTKEATNEEEKDGCANTVDDPISTRLRQRKSVILSQQNSQTDFSKIDKDANIIPEIKISDSNIQPSSNEVDFQENVGSDTSAVSEIDNLIADLDKDLASPKAELEINKVSEVDIIDSEEAGKEISGESLDTCSEIVDKSYVNHDVEKKDILPNNNNAIQESISQSIIYESSSVPSRPTDAIEVDYQNICVESEINILHVENDSSSININKIKVPPSKSPRPVAESVTNDDRCKSRVDDTLSFPDSTNTLVSSEKVLREHKNVIPDSTNELNTEMNSTISSTNESKEMDEQPNKSTNAAKETLLNSGSLGNLLSILQDKSKIKELLSLLNDNSSGTEKIKKKLEKLTEIVSDDEDISENIKDVSKQTEPNNDDLCNSVNEVNVENSSEQILALEPIHESKNEKNSALLQVNKTSTVKKFKKKKIKSKKKISSKKVPTESSEERRTTRAGAVGKDQNKNQKWRVPRELLNLQKDLKDKFLTDGALNVTGLRMCRLAKLVDENNVANKKNELDEIIANPNDYNMKLPKKNNLKVNINDKLSSPPNIMETVEPVHIPKYRPGPKSKKTLFSKKRSTDPYAFESDTLSETAKVRESSPCPSSGSDNESLALYKGIHSSEIINESKPKPKRKKSSWRLGIIKSKIKKKRNDQPSPQKTNKFAMKDDVTIKDLTLFTDKNYCFYKNKQIYLCKLCVYEGRDIVEHHKESHPHYEVPLSRMNPKTANEAIKQSLETDFQSLKKVITKRHTCRFCFDVFDCKKSSLEQFFKHVVTMHTGEYKNECSQCTDESNCPFTLDIPNPPLCDDGLLLGYICGECNYTQISLENLKTHVAVRHDNEQTAVYAINIGDMTQKAVNALGTKSQIKIDEVSPKTSRSLRSNRNSSIIESDEKSDIETALSPIKPPATSIMRQNKPCPASKKVKTKISFEPDDILEKHSMNSENSEFNNYKESEVASTHHSVNYENLKNDATMEKPASPVATNTTNNKCLTRDLYVDAHFKVFISESGIKEYVCCINGSENHYATALLISMKKHVELKHKEIWDGYCYICKVIVTTQGKHYFKECLSHFLNKHMDDFPIFNKSPSKPSITLETPKTYLNIRPLAELMSKSPTNTNDTEETCKDEMTLPRIEHVMSLNETSSSLDGELPEINTSLQTGSNSNIDISDEILQAEILSQKHIVIARSMLTPEKLMHLFKCAGKYCSFTTDSPEEALLHGTTHKLIGGEGALRCIYCSFSKDNGIDLVFHVFKNHGNTPYFCKLCFYRGAFSSLVELHIKRMHPNTKAEGCVLQSSNESSTPKPTQVKCLTRDEAVPLYICTQDIPSEGRCRFRHYIQDKFLEHFQQNHTSDKSFSCSFCSETFNVPLNLVEHLKSHGLHMYQCVWCVHGATSELDILNHASERHHNHQPHAYFRQFVETGNGKSKVLPLVYINAKSVMPVAITTIGIAESPVKEAERAVELEKLLGVKNEITPKQTLSNATIPELRETLVDTAYVETGSDVHPSELGSIHIVNVNSLTNEANSETIFSKTNVQEDNKPKESTTLKVPRLSQDIICLESDEEDSKEGILGTTKQSNLSIEESSNRLNPSNPVHTTSNETSLQFPSKELFKCRKCEKKLSNIKGFKKHLTLCYGRNSQVQCAFCDYVTKNRKLICDHYINVHSKQKRYICFICQSLELNLQMFKKHMLFAHSINKVTDAQLLLSAQENTTTIQKQSAGNVEPRKYYGPSDIDSLPINAILDENVYCSLCEFCTKVRLNMVRHLLQHANQMPVAHTAPVNPVPHLKTNEKHFDKMANLAASSNVLRNADKHPNTETVPVFKNRLHSDISSKYPQFVPIRKRFACGATNCSYISVDDAMLSCHWDALHAGSNEYRCVHCPPTQKVDTSRPLTASRIMTHLKMHDACLYACTKCNYYHYQKQLVERHLNDRHKENSNKIMVIREPVAQTLLPAATNVVAPTMDLKPWQCGLCEFKSMLRPEVINHCANKHNSKFQFKCHFCQWSSSGHENVVKHHSTSHADKVGDVFHFYYRQGSLLDEQDGTPRWVKQRDQMGPAITEVKTETANTSNEATPLPPETQMTYVNLNLVKDELDDESELTIDYLKRLFGKFCEPKENKYVCPLCNVFMDDSEDVMTSHLYEELNYRKWSCSYCPYKAFHKIGLMEHTFHEHRSTQEPIPLPSNIKVETWVTMLLNYQEKVIKQLEAVPDRIADNPNFVCEPSSSEHLPDAQQPFTSISNKFSTEVLELAFGSFGHPVDLLFSCPKCEFLDKDESKMFDHLEIELAKVRWGCSMCHLKFHTYHQVQLHCKSVHIGEVAKIVEAPRDPEFRSAWILSVIQKHKLVMSEQIKNQSFTSVKFHKTGDTEVYGSNSEPNDNSLLVVHYEKNVPTPEVDIVLSRKRPLDQTDQDSDEESFVIDETANSIPRSSAATGKDVKLHKCTYCDFCSKTGQGVINHMPRHFKLKPFRCGYCDYNSQKIAMYKHCEKAHPDLPKKCVRVVLPSGPPLVTVLPKRGERKTGVNKPESPTSDNLVCLLCENYIIEPGMKQHMDSLHSHLEPQFAKKGAIVYKCCICLKLRKNLALLKEHHAIMHPNSELLYSLFRLEQDKRNTVVCNFCQTKFTFMRDLRAHHDAVHSNMSQISYSIQAFSKDQDMEATEHATVSAPDNNIYEAKRKLSMEDLNVPPTKRIAKKSTSKLHIEPNQRTARKSTSKLPLFVDEFRSDNEKGDNEFSFYGTKGSTLDDHANVTTSMPLCGTVMPFTVKTLSEIVNLSPKVAIDKS